MGIHTLTVLLGGIRCGASLVSVSSSMWCDDKYEVRRFFRTGTVTQSVGCLDGNDIILVVVVVVRI